MNRVSWLIALLCVFLASSGDAAFPVLYLKNVCDDQLHAPTNITNAGDGSGRLFICDQPGKIYVFQNGMLLPTPLLDLSSTGTGDATFFTAPAVATGYSERGLLGMCFHPDFANPSAPGYRRFYVNYTTVSTYPTLNPVIGTSTNCVSVIAEFKISATNPNVADPSSKRVVLTYGQPQSNHKGGQIEFGPDGYLYIGTGDGGGQNDNSVGHTEGTATSSPGVVSGTLGNGQDRRRLLAKILRIDPLGTDGPGGSYGIPWSNPFVGQTQTFANAALNGPMRGEIYAYGMRNPWRFCFDFDFGGASRMICADVGQDNVEELDFIVSGGNFGWRVKEGSVDFDMPTAYSTPPTVIAPFAQYAHPTSTLPATSSMVKLGTSITGGYVYRGSAIPSMQGKYICADYAYNGIGGGGGILIGVEETSPGIFSAPTQLTTFNALPASARIYCFGVADDGEIYMATKTTFGVTQLDGGKPAGTIWKLSPVNNVTVNLSANRDNTMYEGETKSNGIGQHMYAGRVADLGNYALRRALVRFDLSPIPTGVVLTSASVSLTVTKQVSQDWVFALHKATSDWGEGSSNADTSGGPGGGQGAIASNNDATWTHRFYNATTPASSLLWTSQGGDFVSSPSATTMIHSMFTGNPEHIWTGGGLLADVQSWIAAPSSNFGWVVKGSANPDPNGNGDAEEIPSSAQRFGSRNNTTASVRPKLTVTYATTPPLSRYETWFNTNFPTSPPGTYLDPAGDSDGDGIANLVEYAYNLNPTTRNAPNSGLTTGTSDDGINTTFSVTFLRDPTATDLTYELESSDDLVNWTTIVTSVAGNVPTGSGYASESAIAGQSPMRLVVASEELPGVEALTHFVRLKVTRAP